MADVFLAVTEGATGINFNKLVVLKKLREHLVGDVDFVSMFMDEARLAARLNHPNVVQTLEVDRAEGELILAMEYLDGQPLHRLLARTRESLPLEMHLAILHDVLAGLEHAHELRDYDGSPLHVVHRDVTPQNIFITYDGQVKVVDFGIAKAEGRQSETKHGVVKGKIAYMSPEQARAEVIDCRADIFAVGVMLYEAVARKRMWAGFGEQEIVRALIHGRVPNIRSVFPGVDPAMAAILTRALAPTTAARFQTALEFQVALEAYQDAHAPRPSSRQLGKKLSDLFADRRQVTREVIESQLADLKGARLNLVALPLQDIPITLEPMASEASEATEVIGPPSATSLRVPSSTSSSISMRLASASSVTNPPPSLTPPVHRRLPLAAIAAGVLLLAVLAAAVFARSSAAEGGSGQIDVSLRAEPASVHFSIDQGAQLPNPYRGSAAKDNKDHVIRAWSDGYEEKSRTIRFDDDISLSFTLRARQ
jgi:eukaryotic-like serine/threonine-protein kinase